MSERPAVSLIVVAHRSSGVLPTAVDSFRREAATLGVTAEVVVVDHSEDAGELARLATCRPDRLLPLPNRGYAAGVNAGAAAATGEVLLIANPDIELRPGALGALLDALRDGWDVTGPQFELADFRFPPADPQGPGEEVRRWLAARSPAAWRRAFGREITRWQRLWEADGPVEVPTLSGALLALPTAALARVGPWDEGYFLYFEETDWLRRARAAGLRLAAVPTARVEHAWGHTAEPAAHGATFTRSRARFLAKHFGLAGRLTTRLEGGATGWTPPLAGLPALPKSAVLFASPLPLAMPAALAPADEAPDTALARFARAARLASLTTVAWDPSRRVPLGVWRLEMNRATSAVGADLRAGAAVAGGTPEGEL